MTTYDRNVVNVQAWQQQVMDLHDKVDVLERKSSTLVAIVKMLEERANNWKLQITETEDSPAMANLTRAYNVTMSNLAHYSIECEQRAIELMVFKQTLDVERGALLAHMGALQALQREAGELQREAERAADLVEHAEEPL